MIAILLVGTHLQGAEEAPKSQIAILEQKVKDEPENATYWNDLGVAYGQHGEWKNAVIALKKAVALKRDYAHAWYNLGLAYEKAGVLPKAVTAYKQAIQVQNPFPEALLSLGVVYYKQGNIADARTVVPILEEQNAKMAKELARLLEQPAPISAHSEAEVKTATAKPDQNNFQK